MDTSLVFLLRNITKTYPGEPQPALSIQQLKIPRNKSIAIIGHSGSGKTTLLNSLGMLDTPDSPSEGNSSEILFSTFLSEDEPTQITTRNLASEKEPFKGLKKMPFGYVFQEAYLLNNLNCKTNIQLPYYISGMKTSIILINDLLDNLNLPHGEFAKKLPSELSGGEAQRIALLRGTIHNPEVLFADEPTSRLDSSLSLQIMGMLTEWCYSDPNRTLIWITHNLKLATEFSQHIIALQDSRIVFNGPNPNNQDTLQRTIDGHSSRIPCEKSTLSSNDDQPAERPLVNTFKFIFRFAWADLFTPTKKTIVKKDLKTDSNIRPVASGLFWGGLRSLLRTQGLNLFSVFFVMWLALFFLSVSFWIRNYFVYSLSDERLTNIVVAARTAGMPNLQKEDEISLASLCWVKNPEGGKTFITSREDQELNKYKYIRPAVKESFGARGRIFDFKINPEKRRGWSGFVPLSIVIMNTDDPILKKINILFGKNFNSLKTGDKTIADVWSEQKATDVSFTKGIFVSKEFLNRVKYAQSIPETIKMKYQGNEYDLKILGVCDWVPPSHGGKLGIMNSAWYLETFHKKQTGGIRSTDETPGFEWITLYIKDLLEDGIPIAEALPDLGYQQPGIVGLLKWINSFSNIIYKLAILIIAGVSFLVLLTLGFSHAQAISKKQKEIAVLLAHRIRRRVIYAVFMVEVFIVWICASISALLIATSQNE